MYEWSTIVEAVSTLVIAIFAGLQWKISKQQKNISLYKKRYEYLYIAIMNRFSDLTKVFTSENPTWVWEKSTEEFLDLFDKGEFLISKKDYDQLDDLMHEYGAKVTDYIWKCNKAKIKDDSNQMESLQEEQAQLVSESKECYKKIRSVLEPYLRIK